MRAARPLQIPRQVGIAGSLRALFGNILYPLFVQSNAIKGIRLEDAKGKDRGEAACNKKNSNQ